MMDELAEEIAGFWPAFRRTALVAFNVARFAEAEDGGDVRSF